MKTLLRAGTAFVIVVATVLGVTGCAAVSLESVATECGGASSGVYADDSGIAIDTARGTDALICALVKIFPDDSDRYAATELLGDGAGATATLDGRKVSIVSLGGTISMFISAK